MKILAAVSWVMICCALVWAVSALPASAALDHRQGRTGVSDRATVTPSARRNILFQDDFETYSNRWAEAESPKASVSYRDDALRLRVLSPGVAVWSVPGVELILSRYSVQADVRFQGGSPDSQAGFVLHYRDDENFYALVMTARGGWRLLRAGESEWRDLTPDSTESPGGSAEELIVQMRADIRGDTIRLFVNSVLVAETQTDGVLTSGLFGVIAVAGKGYIDVSIDNVRVTDIGAGDTEGDTGS